VNTTIPSEYKSDSVYILEAIKKDDSGNILNEVRGTCFAISPTFLLTANHIIADSDELRIYFSSNNFDESIFSFAKCVYSNESKDFCILEAEDVAPNSIGLYSTSISLDVEVKSCGFPIEKQHYCTPISVKVSNVFEHITSRQYSFEVSQSDYVSVYKGMSGSPVLHDGLCVGLLLVQQGSNTLYAVSVKDILADSAALEITHALNLDVRIQEGIHYTAPDHPASPFTYCINCNVGQPNIKGIDIGFTMKVWNLSSLTETVYDWIIDYCLSHKEKANFSGPERGLFKHARANYPANDMNALGDLFLHIAIRDSYKTIPIMNKVFDMNNKTFSCTHVVLNLDDIELWIGASSVSTNIDEAVTAAIRNIEYIVSLTTLKQRLFMLTAEIDESWPHTDKLKRLANSGLTIDERFDKIIIPVFLMHDSSIITNYDQNSFIQLFNDRIQECRNILVKAIRSDLLDLINFYFPVSDVSIVNEALVKELNS
jgi:Cap4 SAVED domain/Trypsin-like peptidase domain